MVSKKWAPLGHSLLGHSPLGHSPLGHSPKGAHFLDTIFERVFGGQGPSGPLWGSA